MTPLARSLRPPLGRTVSWFQTVTVPADPRPWVGAWLVVGAGRLDNETASGGRESHIGSIVYTHSWDQALSQGLGDVPDSRLREHGSSWSTDELPPDWSSFALLGRTAGPRRMARMGSRFSFVGVVRESWVLPLPVRTRGLPRRPRTALLRPRGRRARPDVNSLRFVDSRLRTPPLSALLTRRKCPQWIRMPRCQQEFRSHVAGIPLRRSYEARPAVGPARRIAARRTFLLTGRQVRRAAATPGRGNPTRWR